MKARLILEPRTVSDGILELAGVLELPAASHRLWWRLPVQWSDAVTPWADPFVIAFLFPLMAARADVMVEGQVSPSLLANLERYMVAWHTWCPDRYTAVDIQAREEVECPPAGSGKMLTTFSCGVDSCFTAYRHAKKLVGRRSQPLAAGVLMNGFDIRPEYPGAIKSYAGMLAAAREMLGSLNMACIPLSTNFRDIPTLWAQSHVTQLVAGMRLLAGEFDGALIPNSVPYVALDTLWGSHPVSDPFLSSRHFSVADDGADANRMEKLSLIGSWPEAMANIRVCFGTPESDHHNCCVCEKCIRTILSARLAGLPRPGAFAKDATDDQIARVRFMEIITLGYWEDLVLVAEKRGRGQESWVHAMRKAIAHHYRRERLNKLKRPFIPLRNTLRAIFRGSPKSKRELTAVKS